MKPEKLVMDLPSDMPLRLVMDDERITLAIALCTQVGMAMEDMSIIALTTKPADAIVRRVEELSNAIREMDKLIAAARVLAGSDDR